MSKFPRLEMMRAQRRRREDEVTAPYKAELQQAAGMISSLRQKIRAIEEFMGRDIAKHVIENIAHGLRDGLMKTIYKEVAKANKGPHEPILIALEPSTIHFMDPDSIERMVLHQYTSRQLPKLSLRVDVDPMECATIVDIHVPELGYRQMVATR